MGSLLLNRSNGSIQCCFFISPIGLSTRNTFGTPKAPSMKLSQIHLGASAFQSHAKRDESCSLMFSNALRAIQTSFSFLLPCLQAQCFAPAACLACRAGSATWKDSRIGFQAMAGKSKVTAVGTRQPWLAGCSARPIALTHHGVPLHSGRVAMGLARHRRSVFRFGEDIRVGATGREVRDGRLPAGEPFVMTSQINRKGG